MTITTLSKRSIVLKLDYEDYINAINYKWYNKKRKNGEYIYTMIGNKMHSLNKIIFNTTNKKFIYFKNNDSCDYRRKNILFLTRSEYGHKVGGSHKKTSKYNGVYYCNTTKKWWVRVTKEEKICSEHCYDEEIEAAIVADYMSITKYGSEIANRNFVNYSYEEIVYKYNIIKKKYGSTVKEIKSRSTQGISRVKVKASKYVGVTKNKNRLKQWCAKIKKDGKTIFIGNYMKEIDAAVAYDNKAKKLFGEFAKTNF